MKPSQIPQVLIVTYNRLECTKRCIEAVLKYTPQPMTLILVDNASRAEVKQFLMQETGIKVFLDENVGLYRALNIGTRLLDNELVAFLDCDIIVREGWWESLSAEVKNDPGVGLAGSRYLNCDGSLQEGYPLLTQNGWYGCSQVDLDQPADSQYIAIGCSVFRRSAWEKLGGFDEAYFISHGDIDFCYSLRYELGLRIRYCPRSSVVHDRTFGREEEYEATRFSTEICSADYRRFRQKWERRYTNENSGVLVDRAARTGFRVWHFFPKMGRLSKMLSRPDMRNHGKTHF
jgi:GT2 family glycosyltransferase